MTKEASSTAQMSTRRLRIGVAVLAASIVLAACSSTPGATSRVAHTASRKAPKGAPSSTLALTPSGSTPTTSVTNGGSGQPSTNPSVALAPPSNVPATSADRQAAQAAVSTILAAFVAKNWGALYELSASQIRQSETMQAFISSMQAQSMHQIASGKLSGPGSESTQNGSTYWTQGVDLDVRTGGGSPAPFHANMELVEQGGGWEFLTTSTPSPGS